jgi:RNA 3'-terminal phosphate cyclase-like protein
VHTTQPSSFAAVARRAAARTTHDMSSKPADIVRFTGAKDFRTRILLSVLSGRACVIRDIRVRAAAVEGDATKLGLRDYEVSFLRLVDKLTNGTKVDISEDGTAVRFTPGVVKGGRRLAHECATSRGIGYYAEPTLALGLFAKKPIELTLRGVTNDDADVSVDVFRTVTLPMMKKHFGVDEGLSLEVTRRGCPPLGGGEVTLKLPIVKTLPTLDWTDEGLVKRVRGVTFTSKVSPQNGNRMVDAARGVLNAFIPDVYIFTDHHVGPEAGKSPGYGLSLVAETTTGCVLGADAASTACTSAMEEANSVGWARDAEARVPEDMGRRVSESLVAEIQRGGVVDSSHQSMVLILLAAGPDQVSRVRLGQLTPRAIETLRALKAFFGVTFHLEPEPESRTVFCSCVGAGLKNVARRAT